MPVPPDDKPQEPQLVQSGTFLVDRTRALRRLRDYQFQDPKTFLLPWVRCAVLSGASRIEAVGIDEGVAIRFDGRPFDAERLKQPYAALFDETGEQDERYRHLAVGILAALRLAPSSITVVSGLGPQRTRLTITTLDEPETISAIRVPGELTEIEVKWPKSMMAAVGLSPGSANAEGALQRVRAQCRMVRVPLFAGRAVVQPVEEGELGSIEFEALGARFILIAKEYEQTRELHVYRQGVRVAARTQDWALSLAAHVDNDRFQLDASHSGIVDDNGMLEAIERRVNERADELLLKLCGDLKGLWVGWARDSTSVAGLTGLPLTIKLRLLLGRGVIADAGKLAKVQRESKLAGWLRRAAASRLDLMMLEYYDELTPGIRALWEAPLYVSATGKPLTLLELGRQWRDTDRVYYSNPSVHYPDPWVFGFEPTRHVIWLIDERDYCLTKLFHGKLRSWEAWDTLWDLSKIAGRKLTKA